MSIFPKYLLAGQTVVIHTGVKPLPENSYPQTAIIHTTLVDPDGNETIIEERNLLCFPAFKNGNPQEETKGVLPNASPLHIASTYLTGKYNQEFLLDFFKNQALTTHFYTVYQVPTNAAPGKYKIVSQFIKEGKVSASLTASEDYFIVEKINVSCNDTGLIIIQNQSPEPFKGIILKVQKNGEEINFNSIEIDGKGQIEINCDNAVGFLSYCEGREVLPLTTFNTPLVTRDANILTLPSANQEQQVAYISNINSNDFFHLENIHYAVWNKAQCIVPVNTFSAEEKVAVEEMLQEGLLKMFTSGQNET